MFFGRISGIFILGLLSLTSISGAHLDASSYSLKGGEKFIPNQVVKITWRVNIVHEVFDIDFSQDGGITYETIARELPKNSVSYDWSVPSKATTQGRIRVFQHESPHPRMTVTDNWNLVSKNFTIEPPTSIMTPQKQFSNTTPTLSVVNGKLLFGHALSHNTSRKLSIIDVLGHSF